MNTGKRTASALLAAALLLGPAGAGASEPAPPKEEVVYVGLSAGGQVQSVDVVNIFELAQPGQIVDYGDYASVRNMTTTDPVTLADGTVTVDAAKAGRLYYEGNLPDAQLPWQIGLRYYLDGAERMPEEVAGASGALEIRLTVAANPLCRGTFFDDYSLQISFTLDGDKCENIVAEGATVANVGGDKQLTYMVLPGQGADIRIQADVRDFEMDAVAINGVPLTLDVQVDDEELMAQVTDLLDAIAALDEGAGTLSDGAAALEDGAGTASEGASALYAGAASLEDGADALQSGGASVQSGAYSVSTGAADLDAGLQSLSDGLALLGPGLETLNSQSATLTDGSAAVLSALTTLQTQLSGVSVSEDDITAIQTELTNISASVQTLATLVGMADGLKTALTSYQTLANGADGAGGLGAAIGQLDTALGGLDAAIAAVGTAPEPDPEAPPDAPAPTAPDTSALTAASGDIAGVKTTLDGLYADLTANNEALSGTIASLEALDTAALTEELTAIQGTLATLQMLVPLLPQMLDGVKSGVDTLVTDYTTLDTGIQDYTAGVAAIYEGYGTLTEGMADLTAGSATLSSGASSLYSGATTLLSGIVSVYDATGTLTDGAGTLDSGVADLLAGIAALSEGAGTVKDGTAALSEGTDGMDADIEAKIDSLLASVTGGSGEPASFVSEKNGNVAAVQFVIRTEPIRVPEMPEPEPEEQPPLTFWEKLAALF